MMIASIVASQSTVTITRRPGIGYAIHVSACVHAIRSEEHTSELQSRGHLVCRLLLEKKKNNANVEIRDLEEGAHALAGGGSKDRREDVHEAAFCREGTAQMHDRVVQI